MMKDWSIDWMPVTGLGYVMTVVVVFERFRTIYRRPMHQLLYSGSSHCLKHALLHSDPSLYQFLVYSLTAARHRNRALSLRLSLRSI
jgi:hypothetical protein